MLLRREAFRLERKRVKELRAGSKERKAPELTFFFYLLYHQKCALSTFSLSPLLPSLPFILFPPSLFQLLLRFQEDSLEEE